MTNHNLFHCPKCGCIIDDKDVICHNCGSNLLFTVFISHSSLDNPASETIYSYLKDRGMDVWMDTHNIFPGEPYASSIANGVKKCELMVIVVSRNSICSEDVINEIDLAHRMKLDMIPFIIDESIISPELQYYLSRKQWIKASPSFHEHLEELYNAVLRYSSIFKYKTKGMEALPYQMAREENIFSIPPSEGSTFKVKEHKKDISHQKGCHDGKDESIKDNRLTLQNILETFLVSSFIYKMWILLKKINIKKFFKIIGTWFKKRLFVILYVIMIVGLILMIIDPQWDKLFSLFK